MEADGKNENSIYTYSYTNSGKLLTEKISFPDGTSRNIKRVYDKFGRLTEIKDTDKSVKYAYDKKSRLAVQTIDNIPVHFTYTKYGQLESKVMGDDIKNPIGSLKYYYEKDGKLIGRVVNGSVQNFFYDKKGQLLKVTDLAGKVLESYTYDNAGNILEKVINDKKTVYTYDKANQLVTATDADGKNTSYKYDAAGRLSQEASTEATKNYSYGWLDKVTKVDNGTAQSVFNYFPDGQLAEKVVGSDTERFYWDGLALIKRDSREFTNEPAVTGGNPVIANNKVMLNDMLGNSIGAYDKEYQAIDRTAFGETTAKSDIDFLTGKPNIEGLGYSFLFRNYRQDLGKWQTSDPLGYPDGWNNLAYVNNKITKNIDLLGLAIIAVSGAAESSHHAMQNAMNAKFGAGNYTQFAWDQTSQIENFINQLPANEPIVLVGHSYGGDTAYNVAEDSNKNIAALVTLDPVSWLTGADSKPDNVGTWYNVFASDENYTWNDFIADLGGQWGNEEGAINVTAAVDHNNPLGMLQVPLPNGSWNLVDAILYHHVYGE